MATSYWDYIRVEDILELQGGIENDESTLSNHEVLFITVHQVYELWFKLVLRELTALRDFFNQDPVPENSLADGAHSLDRTTRILKIASDHFEIVETIRTRDYLEFRDKLFPASGFQSAQMREMEILLGLDTESRIGFGTQDGWLKALRTIEGDDSPALARVERRLGDVPSLKQAIEAWLYRTPIRGSQPGDADDEAAVSAFLDDYLAQHAEAVSRLVEEIRSSCGEHAEKMNLQKRYDDEIGAAHAFCKDPDPAVRRIRAAMLFIEGYRELPLLAWPRQILGAVVQFEQAMIMFRQRHARMVERVIGRRVGTGGSSGVDYLDETALKYRVFRDLWTVRTLLLRRADMPPLEDKAPYDFASPF